MPTSIPDIQKDLHRVKTEKEGRRRGERETGDFTRIHTMAEN